MESSFPFRRFKTFTRSPRTVQQMQPFITLWGKGKILGTSGTTWNKGIFGSIYNTPKVIKMWTITSDHETLGKSVVVWIHFWTYAFQLMFGSKSWCSTWKLLVWKNGIFIAHLNDLLFRVLFDDVLIYTNLTELVLNDGKFHAMIWGC